MLVLGKNPFWKTHVALGKKHNQEFVQIPHAKFLELLTYKAEASGIRCWSRKRATPAVPASWMWTLCLSMTRRREPSKRSSPVLLVGGMGAGIVSKVVPRSMPM